MIKPVIALLPLVVSALAITVQAAADSPRLNLDIQQISLSGISSGGYMAGQFHIAHSDWVTGVGIIAGGPYYCARNSLFTGLGQCAGKNGEAIDLGELDAIVADWENRKLISPVRHLEGDKVWVLHGSKDDKVTEAVTDKLVAQYQTWVGKDNVTYVNDQPFDHHFPTLASGTACDVSETPYIANCGYDAASQMMQHIAPAQAQELTRKGQLFALDQQQLGGTTASGLAETAYLYAPDSCLQGAQCKVHVSFHGCNQNIEAVGNDYARLTGLNDWADAHHTVVLYPQTKKSSLMPMNPQACWDWWGYTGGNYANQQGPQIQAVANMIRKLAGEF